MVASSQPLSRNRDRARRYFFPNPPQHEFHWAWGRHRAHKLADSGTEARENTAGREMQITAN